MQPPKSVFFFFQTIKIIIVINIFSVIIPNRFAILKIF